MPLADRRPPLVAGPAGPGSGGGLLLSAAVAVAALWFGRDLLVPAVLAGLLAFVLAPVVRTLQGLRLPRALAVVLAVLAALLLLLATLAVIGGQLAELAADLPAYAEALRARLEALRLDDLLGQADTALRGLGLEGPVPSAGAAPVAEPRRSSSALAVLGALLGPVLNPLATAGLVVVFTVLVLLYREDLRDRLVRLAGVRDLHRTMTAMNDAAGRLSRLFLAQVALNAGYGLLMSLLLWAIGLPSPLLWGVLAGLMRFVPFLGTPIALTPPLLLALAVQPGWTMPLLVLGAFLLGASVMGQVLEPLLFGRRTGLSPLSVIVAATFWAFLWGPIGLLISTPLTVGLVVLGRHVERFEFLDVILGDRPPLRPEETFYQRALEGDADGLASQARTLLRSEGGGLAGWGDEVALRGLSLAQADWAREAMEPERLETVRRAVETMIEDVRDLAEAQPSGPARPAGWAAPGAVACVPARGRLDDLSGELAALALRRAGFGAEARPGSALEAAQLDRLAENPPRLCCLSVLEEGNSVAGLRTLLRRLARQSPGTTVVVGLWHATPDSPTLAALREEGPAAAIVTTLGEVVALCEAVSARDPPGRSADEMDGADRTG